MRFKLKEEHPFELDNLFLFCSIFISNFNKIAFAIVLKSYRAQLAIILEFDNATDNLSQYGPRSSGSQVEN